MAPRWRRVSSMALRAVMKVCVAFSFVLVPMLSFYTACLIYQAFVFASWARSRPEPFLIPGLVAGNQGCSPGGGLLSRDRV